MEREIFNKRKEEFKEYIISNRKLPKVWEARFSDTSDMRLWFIGLTKTNKYKDYVDEINDILNKYNINLLSDKEKEQEFLICINNIDRIPLRNEEYFTDNEDMYTWYMNYIITNKDFETQVYTNLKEYLDFDIAEIWPDVKQEFIEIMKKLKRIPKHREAILSNSVDVRVVFNKLQSFDPEFTEKLLLHLQTYKKDTLSFDERKNELLEVVSALGYIPTLQEYRFSDKTDMFTWYTRHKAKFKDLENNANSLITKENPNKQVNIYLIPNFKNKGGKFYTICTNVGERLDLSNITSYEEALKLDKDIVKRGGLILKKDEEISSVSYTKGKK